MASMKISHTIIFFFVFLLLGLLFASPLTPNIIEEVHEETENITRNSFPKDFIFGAGSSAFQYEGAVGEEYGKGPSIWDHYTHQYPEKIYDGSNGDVANDFYHHYKGDIKLAKDIGLDAFRFSISWSRILPTGKISGGINKLGIQFYHDLIDELLANGFKPFATIFHWDLPQGLEDEYGGFLSRNIVDDFVDYANLVFKEFGDKVPYWTTFNEPNLMAEYAYSMGIHAPGRCSDYMGNCPAGDSATEPYIVIHHLLLCHAATVNLYRSNYTDQNGMIGIVGATNMMIPINDTEESRSATLRAIDFSYGWIFDPVVYGRYPETMRSIVGNRLPNFTKNESALLRQSFDFLGLNYYTTFYAMKSSSVNVNLSYSTDSLSSLSSFKDGIPIGEATHSVWLYIYPKGLQELLRYMKAKYNNPLIIITENGVGQKNNGSLANDPTILQDDQRIRYYSGHLSYLLESIKEGANVGGYFVWSWLDDYEWNTGYTGSRVGLTFVDFDNDLKRSPKDSCYWFMKFLTKGSVADA